MPTIAPGCDAGLGQSLFERLVLLGVKPIRPQVQYILYIETTCRRLQALRMPGESPRSCFECIRLHCACTAAASCEFDAAMAALYTPDRLHMMSTMQPAYVQYRQVKNTCRSRVYKRIS